jgi:pimeloyl-ACP methyl ester carboxylesterase
MLKKPTKNNDNRKTRLIALAVGLLAILTAGIVFLFAPYRRDIQAAHKRLQSLDAHTIDTPYGKMEYAIQGNGYPLFLIHGNGGGFDQGLDLGRAHINDGFMGIAPSRFGYLGTSLPTHASPREQAEAFVYLLDKLDIQETAVIAWSAGGMSAIQMALQHPERVSALVLVSTGIADDDEPDEIALPPEAVLQTLFGSDFLFWLLTNPLQSVMQRMFVPATYELTAADKIVMADTMEKLLPIRPRAQGAVWDTLVTITDAQQNKSAYRLEDLDVPTLIINAMDDPLADYETARAMSQRIPQARFVTIEQGGHLMLGSSELVQSEIDAFLRQ